MELTWYLVSRVLHTPVASISATRIGIMLNAMMEDMLCGVHGLVGGESRNTQTAAVRSMYLLCTVFVDKVLSPSRCLC